MKVLMINSVCGIGSTGRICTDLADELMKRGHEVRIAYGRKQAPEKYRDISYRFCPGAEVAFHGVVARLADNEGLYMISSTERLISYIRGFDPDIVHLHNLHGYYLNVEKLFAYLKESGRKVVWTLHDCWSMTGHCASFDYVKCLNWQTGCSSCPQLMSYPKCYLLDNSRRNYQRKKNAFTGMAHLHLVTPSQWLAATVGKSYLNYCPVTVINNGIRTEVFHPVDSDLRERMNLADKKIVLGVSYGWSNRKGYDNLLWLAERLPQNCQVIMIGLSDKQIASLPDNIIGLAKTDNVAQLVEYYTAGDVLVNPTKEEVLGMTSIEALACGTPVVTFRVGGCPEVVDDSCGAIVAVDDNEALLKAVTDICENTPFTREDCVRKGTMFRVEDKYAQYIELYERIMEEDK